MDNKKRIRDLTNTSVAPENTDFLVLDNGTTNKITREDLLSGTPLPADTVDTQAIENDAVTTNKVADGAVTAPKIDLGSMGTIEITSFTAITTTFANYGTNLSLAIPSGCTKVLIVGSVRIQSTSSTLKDMRARIQKDGTENSLRVVQTTTAEFHGASLSIVDVMSVTSGASHTFRLQARTTAETARLDDSVIKIIPLGNA